MGEQPREVGQCYRNPHPRGHALAEQRRGTLHGDRGRRQEVVGAAYRGGGSEGRLPWLFRPVRERGATIRNNHGSEHGSQRGNDFIDR